MDVVLSQLVELTQKFSYEIGSKTPENVETFINERQLLVQQLQGIFAVQGMTNSQKEEIRSILTYDAKIEECISSLKNEAQEWLLLRNTAKTQRSVYETKYGSESYLMDKRK